MNNQLDHLVIGAKTLDEGINYVKKILGVEIPFGGVHLSMGTHNCLMRLGESCFLEVIAINHDAPPPAHPRWYGLDDPFIRLRLEESPVLLTWVINSTNIATVMQNAIFSMGKQQTISRDALSWYFSLPEDGRLFAGGLLPYVISWHSEKHPAENMTDCECRLLSITLHHPQPDWLNCALASIDSQHLVNVAAITDNTAPFITATIATPTGEKMISSGRLG